MGVEASKGPSSEDEDAWIKGMRFVSQKCFLGYGDVRVMKSVNSDQQFAIKTQVFQSQVEFKKQLGKAKEKHKVFQINSIARQLYAKTEINEQLCTNFYKLLLVYEFHTKSLSQCIYEKQKERSNPYSEQQIYFFLDCILSALICFNFAATPHCDVRPSTIFVTSSGQFLLTDINYLYEQQATPYKETILGAANHHRMYLAPEKVQALRQRDMKKLQRWSTNDWQKGDVFSLGLCALEMATLKNVSEELYDLEQMEFKPKALANLLETTKQTYSHSLYSILSMMLDVNYDSRPDFFKVADILQAEHKSELEFQQQICRNSNNKNTINSFDLASSSLLLSTGEEDKALSIQKSPLIQRHRLGSDSKNLTNSNKNFFLNQCSPNSKQDNFSNVFTNKQVSIPGSTKSNCSNLQLKGTNDVFESPFIGNSKQSHPVYLQRKIINSNSNCSSSASMKEYDHLKQTPIIQNNLKHNNQITSSLSEKEREGNISKVGQRAFNGKENDSILRPARTNQQNLREIRLLESNFHQVLEQSSSIKNIYSSSYKSIADGYAEAEKKDNENQILFPNNKAFQKNREDHILLTDQKNIIQRPQLFSDQIKYNQTTTPRQNDPSPYSTKYLKNPRSSPKFEVSPYQSQKGQRLSSTNQVGGKSQIKTPIRSVSPFQRAKGTTPKAEWMMPRTKCSQFGASILKQQAIISDPRDVMTFHSTPSTGFFAQCDQNISHLTKNNSQINTTGTYIQQENSSFTKDCSSTGNLSKNPSRKQLNQDSYAISNQTNTALYELYLKEYESMLQRTTENQITEGY